VFAISKIKAINQPFIPSIIKLLTTFRGLYVGYFSSIPLNGLLESWKQLLSAEALD
jgi:hypothetical protein